MKCFQLQRKNCMCIMLSYQTTLLSHPLLQPFHYNHQSCSIPNASYCNLSIPNLHWSILRLMIFRECSPWQTGRCFTQEKWLPVCHGEHCSEYIMFEVQNYSTCAVCISTLLFVIAMRSRTHKTVSRHRKGCFLLFLWCYLQQLAHPLSLHEKVVIWNCAVL